METQHIITQTIGDVIFNVPSDTPIHCLELLEYCMRKDVFPQPIKMATVYQILFQSYDEWVQIIAEFTTAEFEGDEFADDYGNDFSNGKSSHDVLIHITEVVSCKGLTESIVGIDKWTEAQLILLINLD